jgi:hypothetical protein
MLAEDVFLVSPTRIEDAVVYELIPLNVTTGSDLPITATSANPEIVEVYRTDDENAGYEVWLAARRAGDAQSDRIARARESQVVHVTVTGGLIDRIDFRASNCTRCRSAKRHRRIWWRSRRTTGAGSKWYRMR